MADPIDGLYAFAALVVLIALRIPIGVAMLGVGAGAYMMVRGVDPFLAYLKTAAFAEFANYSLAVVPLFLLMGELASAGGISRLLFRAANDWVGARRGGLAMASIGASAGFGAICGSSLATAATMTRVALPEMQARGYSGALATGSLAAGGTLGILIPPSIVLVLYALLAEQNIAHLFVAALVPGVLAVLGYIATIAAYVRLHPAAGPAGPRVAWRRRWRSAAETWPVLAIFFLVIGGIYAGWFTPSEGAAVGAVLTGLFAVLYGGLRLDGFVRALTATAVATGMVFLILLGAAVFNAFLGLTRLPQLSAAWIAAAELSPWLVLAAVLSGYLILGCVMDSLSMILLTVPVVFPIIVGLDFGLSPAETAIWFGVLAVIVVEIGLVTPPVGLNVFIIHGLARTVPIGHTFRGVLPFLGADVVRVGLLIVFPDLSLLLLRWLS